MMKRCFTVAALVCSVLAVTAHACLWDRDTLAAEARGLPGITEIITGRFDRFPPLFYEMRLERVVGELAADADNLELYDDAGVACDRLGRSVEAIGWMERKLGVMDRLEAEGVGVGEHRYRYLANLGTFHIHRWLKNGADREDMADVERSRELIAAAIELNPEAHFGRERYQLLAIEWILGLDQVVNPNLGQSFLHEIPEFTGKYFSSNNKLDSLGYSDAAHGISGLIVLGNAWESMDVYYALAFALGDRNDSSTARLCMQRVQDLVENGSGSLNDNFNYEVLRFTPSRRSISSGKIGAIELWYSEARAEATRWVTQRNEYLQERLDLGQHPDTNPRFWENWQEPSSPPLIPGTRLGIIVKISAIVLLLLIGFLIYRVILNRSSRMI